MNTIYFNLQEKGGTGKSMLTYLQALKNQFNEKVAFVDLDQSTQTSTHQLLFLNSKEEKRIYYIRELSKRKEELKYLTCENIPDVSAIKFNKTTIKQIEKSLALDDMTDRLFQADINDALKRIDRERFFQLCESFSKVNFEEVYIDLGAPESEQFPKLFTMDFTPEEFKDFEKNLDTKFVFNCVIAGGAMYQSCMSFLDKLYQHTGKLFEIRVYGNLHFFFNEEEQLDHLRHYCKANDLVLIEFGNFNIQQSSGQNIIENIKAGKGISSIHSFATKTVLKRTLAVL